VPKPPTQVLEPLALLKVAGYLGAHLATNGMVPKTKKRRKEEKKRTFQVLARDSESPRLLKATKDLFP
jgi:hypothetical protein